MKTNMETVLIFYFYKIETGFKERDIKVTSIGEKEALIDKYNYYGE